MKLREEPMPISRHTEPYFKVAGRLFGLDFDEETAHRWRQLIYLSKSIDLTIDSSHEEFDDGAIREIIDGFLSDNYLDEKFPLLSPNDDPERYEKLLEKSKEIFEVNKRLRTTPYKGEYLHLREREGQIYAELLLLCSSEYVTQQPSYEEFAKNFRLLGQAGILVDSSYDAQKDFRHGEINVDLSMRDRGMLVLRAMYLGDKISKRALHPLSLLLLGKTAALVFVESFKARD